MGLKLRGNLKKDICSKTSSGLKKISLKQKTQREKSTKQLMDIMLQLIILPLTMLRPTMPQSPRKKKAVSLTISSEALIHPPIQALNPSHLRILQKTLNLSRTNTTRRQEKHQIRLSMTCSRTRNSRRRAKKQWNLALAQLFSINSE